MSSEKKDVLLETDDEARALAKTLIRTARFAALATVDAESGLPLATRTLMATDMDGTPVILVSQLSAHTKALLASPACSLLVGEPGKGDPLAHARASLFCTAEQVDRESDEGQRIRRRFLARHRKAEFYVDFPDFLFFKLGVSKLLLNGGFARAYVLGVEDSIQAPELWQDLAGWEERAVSHMNEDHSDAVELYATGLLKQEPGPWKLACLDPEGMELVAGDRCVRYPFEAPIPVPSDMQKMLVRLAKEGREAAAAQV